MLPSLLPAIPLSLSRSLCASIPPKTQSSDSVAKTLSSMFVLRRFLFYFFAPKPENVGTLFRADRVTGWWHAAGAWTKKNEFKSGRRNSVKSGRRPASRKKGP
uniref:Putative secreted protein n=1 Tax=Anopheles marajoara TaxID=58244 RepID=A0A2M4C9L2_9DIPT